MILPFSVILFQIFEMTALLYSTKVKSTPRLLVLLFVGMFTTTLMILSTHHLDQLHTQDHRVVHLVLHENVEEPMIPKHPSVYSKVHYNSEELQDLIQDNQFYLTPSWRRYLSRDVTVREEVFQPSMNTKEKNLLYETLQQLQEACESVNATCIMYGGTLLGSWRHHDIIPWDGDADIIVNTTYKDDLYVALNMYFPAYEVIHTSRRFKFYSRKAKKMTKNPWKWPYVDIWFFSENSTHLWDEIESKAYKRQYIYPKDIVFPTHKRPFGKILFNAPRDTFCFLQLTYETTDCETYFYNHKLEKTERWRYKSVPCKDFRDNIGFVYRYEYGPNLVEVLYQGNHKMHALLVNEPSYAISDPFNLTLI